MLGVSSTRYYNIKNIKKLAKDVSDEIATEVSKEISDFVVKLKNALKKATPKDTTHGAINWIIRQSPRRVEYGKRPPFPSDPEKRPYKQPVLDGAQSGDDIAKTYDIRKNRYALSIVNYVPYVQEIDEGTHPTQEEDPRHPLQRYIGFVDRVVKIFDTGYIDG